jgi:hypothetical protein
MTVRTKRLTPRQAAYVKAKIDNPLMNGPRLIKIAGIQAANANTARVAAHKLENHPRVQLALKKASDVFESVIVGTANDWGNADVPRKREIALNAAMYGYDHIYGKATTKIEQQTSVVQISIDLTGGNETPPQIIDT